MIYSMNKAMRTHIVAFFSILFLGSFVFSGCKIQEGPGGIAIIKGRVINRDWDYTNQIYGPEYPAKEKDIYLIYGDDDFYGDDLKTHYDGSFRFDFLRKGKYTLYTYTNDTTGTVAGVKIPIFFEVNIEKKNGVIDLGTIYVAK